MADAVLDTRCAVIAVGAGNAEGRGSDMCTQRDIWQECAPSRRAHCTTALHMITTDAEARGAPFEWCWLLDGGKSSLIVAYLPSVSAFQKCFINNLSAIFVCLFVCASIIMAMVRCLTQLCTIFVMRALLFKHYRDLLRSYAFIACLLI